LVDTRPIRDTTHLEGKELEFKVIKLDAKRNNVVVSRRAVMEAESSADREALLAQLEEGQTVTGTIKNLTDYGAFVDLGGIDGLLHITDMAWKRIKHPSEVVEVGQEVTVKVLKFDRERNRVSLGLKQLGEDPWLAIMNRYPKGSIVKARVTNLTDYGCFAEIAEGVEGLVHVSEMENVVVFLLVSNKLVLTHGKSLLKITTKAKKFLVRSNLSLTLVSSSVYQAVSMV
jgi:small subunit ribosomal protein S1